MRTMATETTHRIIANVFGATGAVGKAVVHHLLHNSYENVDITVRTIGRRTLDKEDLKPFEESGKLEQIVIDMDGMEQDTNLHNRMKQDTDTITFCCLGTTRSAAGSADEFRRVDLTYVESAAKVAKQCGSRVFGLVSAQGARASTMSSDMKLFHGLLYMKTKGMAEERVKDQGFEYTLIMRPGLIDRKRDARGIEKFAKRFLSHVSTDEIASVMVRKAIDAVTSAESTPRVEVLEMKDILTAAAHNKA